MMSYVEYPVVVISRKNSSFKLFQSASTAASPHFFGPGPGWHWHCNENKYKQRADFEETEETMSSYSQLIVYLTEETHRRTQQDHGPASCGLMRPLCSAPAVPVVGLAHLTVILLCSRRLHVVLQTSVSVDKQPQQPQCSRRRCPQLSERSRPQTAAPSSCAMKSHTAAAKSPPH